MDKPYNGILPRVNEILKNLPNVDADSEISVADISNPTKCLAKLDTEKEHKDGKIIEGLRLPDDLVKLDEQKAKEEYNSKLVSKLQVPDFSLPVTKEEEV
ncbi:MAG: hypothetical protein LBO69_09830 [Ignavibacteria bacterium]|nr:hypothetical protein [Ignavibacteria bacterium]